MVAGGEAQPRTQRAIGILLPMPCATRLTLRLLIASLLLPASFAPGNEELNGWASVPAILDGIQPPRFPDRDFALPLYGGVADGKTDSKPAFDKRPRSSQASLTSISRVVPISAHTIKRGVIIPVRRAARQLKRQKAKGKR